MSNLKHNNFHDYRLIINNDEYWDLYLCKDRQGKLSMTDGVFDECLLSSIDLSDESCVGDDGWIYSSQRYTWDKSVAIGHTLYNISYLGTDNGLFTFRKDRITNKDFTEIFQSNKYVIEEGDYRIKLHKVSGSTLQYDYPLSISDGSAKLNGGFYQGFFKTECDKYQVLPSEFNDEETFHIEMTMKKCDFEKESDKTLNDKYPENKGIFFYLGTRAENKWVYLYDSGDTDGLESCVELGLDDFVEGGEIDKKDYIIGNFYDLSVDFEEENAFELGDYTDYEYYDESWYERDACDWEDMSDYLQVDYSKPAVVIDEDAKPKEILAFCGCGQEEETETVLLPFFVGCACPVRYKKVVKSKEKSDDDFLFGDGYIDNFDGLDYETQYVEDELDITDFQYYTDNGFNLGESNQYYFYTDNKFLMFDRTKDGYTVNNWVEGTKMMYYGRKHNYKGNLFIMMNRTKTGYTIDNIDTLIDQESEPYNPYESLYENAFALRITDEGAIGYRLLTKDCSKEGRDKTTIVEGYSFDNVIPQCEWFTVNVKFEFHSKTMRLLFYVNGKLVYITKEIPKLRLRELDEIYEKQEGVPYNISIGGGTQGLAETIQPNYMLNPTRVYPLEKYFGGSFIGYIKTFRLYGCEMEKLIIDHNFQYDASKVMI